MNPEQPEALSPKELEWRSKIEKVAKRKDKVGGEMDPGIIESVVALNLHKFPTSASCEGHLDHGYAAPWVAIEAVNEPKERYNDQAELEKRVCEKHGLTMKQIRDGEHMAEWRELCELYDESGESDAFKTWRIANDQLRDRMERLIEEYRALRTDADPSAIPTIELSGGAGAFRIYVGSPERDQATEEMTDAGRTELAERLRVSREEMKLFTAFLKQKYFAAPEHL